MNSSRDGFSGFLDGYKAQNLKSVEESANFQSMQKLTANLFKKYPNDNIYSFLLSISKINTASNGISSLGKNIKALLIDDNAKDAVLKNDNDFKQLVLNYMDIAKKFSDSDILNTAIEIGELLNS